MSQSLKIIACRTCLRDNPGEGIFSSPETVEREYREKLKTGWLRKTADFEIQNCFTECKDFHCVRVLQGEEGVHLKKISSPEKIDQVIEWVRQAKKTGELELPKNLAENLLYPIKDSKAVAV